MRSQGIYFHHRLYRTSCRHARGGIFLKDLDRVAALNIGTTTTSTNNSSSTTSTQQQALQQSYSRLNSSVNMMNTTTAAAAAVRQCDPLARMVLVDNSPLSFICQPCNGVLVSSWYDDVYDNALSSVLQLIRHLDACDDVRPTLQALFGLEPVLKEYQEVCDIGRFVHKSSAFVYMLVRT
jgi:TFIIF-interacting CTD phosphatase-like protein